MKNEFVLAFNEVLEEKQLPKEIILQALESAMVSAYRRAVNASNAQQVEAKIDPETGKVAIFAEKEVVESVQDNRTEVSLEDAQRVDPEAALGSMVTVESTPTDFGRVAAQTARQVIQQRIRDAERQAQLAFFQKQLGEIVSGVVQAVNTQGLTIGMEMRAEGNMSRKDMIPGERFRIHDRVRALIAEVKDSPRGPQIVLSRTHRDFLRRLLENEVPEIFHGVVEIRSIAREPGERAKVAVSTSQTGIDPVGACVGIRGVRIQTIVRELHDEKIDVIEWNNDPAAFISKAISPARVNGVYLTDKNNANKTATVVVPEDQLSLAIGRDGQNARLAAKLTGWRIDIKSLSEATSDAIARVQSDPDLSLLFQPENELLSQISVMVAKKAEGRPLTPEEYEVMARFVDRVEKRSSQQVPAKKVEDARTHEIQAAIPPDLFKKNILDSGLAEHVAYILQEAGFATVGDLVTQMKLEPDRVFKLQGIGPRAMTDINNLMDSLTPVLEGETPQAEVPAAVIPVEEAPQEVAAPVVEEPVVAAVEPVLVAVETLAPAEAPAEILAVEATAQTEVETSEAGGEKEEVSFDELFRLKSSVPTQEIEEEEDDSDSSKSKKQKKKKKFVEVTYDPDRDVMVVRKKHKRGGEPWDWEP